MTQQYNALKHGMFTKATLLPFENKRQYQRFRRNIVASLCCENDLQTERAYSIADSAWRLERLKKQIYYREKSIYDQLTPQMICAFAQVPEEFHTSAPDFLCNLQHKIGRGDIQYAYQVLTQYEDCHDNFSTIPNLVAVFQKYPDLFDAANHYAQSKNQKAIINSATQTLDPIWQQHTATLWKYLKAVYEQTYFIYHWKSIQKAVTPWVEAWYFNKESQDHQLTRFKELQIKSQTDFRKELAAYAQLKKNQWLFSKTLLELAGQTPIVIADEVSNASCNALIELSGLGANIMLGTASPHMSHIYSNSNLTANVSSHTIEH